MSVKFEITVTRVTGSVNCFRFRLYTGDTLYGDDLNMIEKLMI